MQQTSEPFLPPKVAPYNKFKNGNGRIRLTTQAEQVPILQLLILPAQELGHLEQLQTGETSAASSVIKHALRLLRQLERPIYEKN